MQLLMKTFTDSAGRTWTISIAVDAIKRVQQHCDVNLADITSGDPPLLTRLEVDLVLLCDVIYALVKPQAEQAGVSDEDFGRALGGDAILAAHDAFWNALSDFFQRLRRADQVRAIQKQTALVQAAVTTDGATRHDRTHERHGRWTLFLHGFGAHVRRSGRTRSKRVPVPVLATIAVVALVLLPFVVGGLTLLGLADTWLDFRRRLSASAT
jgi:hypothetical protein